MTTITRLPAKFSGILFPELLRLDSQNAADAVAAPRTLAGLIDRMRNIPVSTAVSASSPLELKVAVGSPWVTPKLEMPVPTLPTLGQPSLRPRRERLF